MKIVKLIPFYLFLSYNVLLVSLFIVTYQDMMNYDMHWGYEGCSLGYKSKLNYTIMILANIIVLVFSSIYAWRKRKENLLKAYIAVSMFFFIYLVKYICYDFNV